MKKAIFFALAATLTVTSWAQTKQAVPVKPATAVKKVVTNKAVASKPTTATTLLKRLRKHDNWDHFENVQLLFLFLEWYYFHQNIHDQCQA